MNKQIKFSVKNRLYISGFISKRKELIKLLTPYGAIRDVVYKCYGLGFVTLDYRANAQKATRELNGLRYRGSRLHVQFARTTTSVRVKYLQQYVTDDLLYKSFQLFGRVERAFVIQNSIRQSTGEGIVVFTHKRCAKAAVETCSKQCFLLTSSLRPCVCELITNHAGLQEEDYMLKLGGYIESRSCVPRIADNDSFEHEYGMMWKNLYDSYHQQLASMEDAFEKKKKELDKELPLLRKNYYKEKGKKTLFEKLPLELNQLIAGYLDEKHVLSMGMLRPEVPGYIIFKQAQKRCDACWNLLPTVDGNQVFICGHIYCKECTLGRFDVSNCGWCQEDNFFLSE